jgi:CelD/BcsL family acetyltransferase involved in cellulose biosynthesis
MSLDTGPRAALAAVVVDPCRDPRWQTLQDNAVGSLFSSPPWLRAIEATYGFPLTATALSVGDDDDALVAGIVACELDDALGRRIVGAPFCDFCDLLGPASFEVIEPLLGSLVAAGVPLKLRLLDPPSAATDLGLRAVGDDFWHGVGLERDDDQMWSSLGSTGRRNVKKAMSAGVTVRFDDSKAGVDAFFEMHLGTRRAKHRMLAQPRAFFHRIWEQFVELDGVSVALAEHDGEPVAGIFLLTWNGRTYYKFNASSVAGLAMRPNDLLMWETMRWSRDRGSTLLDLGLSDADQPGLVRYKQKFATVEGRVVTLAGGPDRSPQASELLSALGSVTAALTDERVPGDVAERVSDAIYRYFT